jgi:hypothetical protein
VVAVVEGTAADVVVDGGRVVGVVSAVVVVSVSVQAPNTNRRTAINRVPRIPYFPALSPTICPIGSIRPESFDPADAAERVGTDQ